MTDRRPRTSVFAKLLTIMLVMAAGVLVSVIGFFVVIFNPVADESVEGLNDDWARRVAATSPDLAAARRLTERVAMEIRYEGPKGTWSTDEDMPSIERVRTRRGPHFPLGGRSFYIVPAPDGGQYLFFWTFRRTMIAAHDLVVGVVLAVIVAVVVTAYFLLRQLLRPLRPLGEGVARLSRGELDVVLPNRTRDEFGVLTDAFNEMVSRVAAMIRARDQLLIDVSHELRSPLTRMRVALEMLPEGTHREHMARDISEMELMIGELLELERLRDGRGLRIERHDLVALLRDLAAPLVSAPAEAHADVDAEKFRTVIRNLLENAAKYAAGATVTVALTDTAVVIEVLDDGPGIPESDLPNLFEPFFRVNRSRAKTPTGYGLGLSICKRILEAHGGTISARNREEGGAAFTVTWPRG